MIEIKHMVGEKRMEHIQRYSSVGMTFSPEECSQPMQKEQSLDYVGVTETSNVVCMRPSIFSFEVFTLTLLRAWNKMSKD